MAYAEAAKKIKEQGSFTGTAKPTRGWTGRLPHGLLFVDSPEAVFQKMGRPADVLSEEELEGFALWHFPDYSLQVRYGTLDNWILNLRILAPGVWDSY